MKSHNKTRAARGTRGSGQEPATASKRSSSPVLVRWTQVFPLSAGPEQRIRRQAGAEIAASELAAATASYVQQIGGRLPERLSFDIDGSVRGPLEQSQVAAQALFGAAFDTDVDAILRQVRQT